MRRGLGLTCRVTRLCLCGVCVFYLVLLPGHSSVCDQFLCVFLQNWFLLLDLFVHQRLSEHRLVHLVVTHPTVRHLHRHRQVHVTSFHIQLTFSFYWKIQKKLSVHWPGRPPRPCGTWLSTQLPPCRRKWRPQGRPHWHGRWERWRLELRPLDTETIEPCEDQWWNRSGGKSSQLSLSLTYLFSVLNLVFSAFSLLPGCWQQRARCHVWCRTAGQTDGRFHRRYPDLQTLRLHGAGWTSPVHTHTQGCETLQLLLKKKLYGWLFGNLV